MSSPAPTSLRRTRFAERALVACSSGLAAAGAETLCAALRLPGAPRLGFLFSAFAVLALGAVLVALALCAAWSAGSLLFAWSRREELLGANVDARWLELGAAALLGVPVVVIGLRTALLGLRDHLKNQELSAWASALVALAISLLGIWCWGWLVLLAHRVRARLAPKRRAPLENAPGMHPRWSRSRPPRP